MNILVPNKPGWWWRMPNDGDMFPERVEKSGYDGRLMHAIQYDSDSDVMHGFDVKDDGQWRGECVPPSTPPTTDKQPEAK